MKLIYKVIFVLFAASLIAGCGSKPGKDTGAKFTKVKSGDIVSDTSSSPSASWVDFDNDGDDDLYVLNGFASLEEDPSPQKNKLYRNDGNNRFTLLPNHVLVQDVTFSGSSTWGDYDNDGDPDLFVGNQNNADNYLFRNDGSGAFTRITEGHLVNDGGRTFSAVWVDVDNDSWLDLHVLNGIYVDGGQVDFLYRNLGNGKFENITNNSLVTEVLSTGGAAWGDYDNDGDPDVFIPIYSNRVRNQFFRNDGDWKFTNVTNDLLQDNPLPYFPKASVAHWVDYDNDLDLDLFIGTVGTIDFLYKNDGKGNFERVTAGRIGLDVTYVSDSIFGDFDNDGDQDIVIAVWGGASEYYENDGNGNFYPKEAGEFGGVINFASSVSADDADGDGDLDLYLTQWPINQAGGMPNEYYINNTHGRDWLEVKLEGTKSNRSGIGAKVIVTSQINGKVTQQIRSVVGRTSWRSTSSLIQHFGLGNRGNVDKIEVIWPSGGRDEITSGIDINKKLTIREGSGLVN